MKTLTKTFFTTHTGNWFEYNSLQVTPRRSSLNLRSSLNMLLIIATGRNTNTLRHVFYGVIYPLYSVLCRGFMRAACQLIAVACHVPPPLIG
jgi:hypothetical protein